MDVAQRSRVTSPSRTTRALQRIAGAYTGVFSVAGRVAGPLLDLYVRLWLAQTFLVSGLLKAASWDNALALARYEYPVSWLDPVTAAYTGVSIELIAPLFLVLGLATRAAAALLMMLALVIQLSYQALDTHLLWAALLGWYIVRGAGPLSLDRLLAPGLADSALPLAASTLKASAWVTCRLQPWYLLALRLWLAAALLAAARLVGGEGIDRALVTASVAAVPAIVLPLIAALLAVGLALRPAALFLLVFMLGVEVMHPAQVDSTHYLVFYYFSHITFDSFQGDQSGLFRSHIQ